MQTEHSGMNNLISLPGSQEGQRFSPGKRESPEQPAAAGALHTVETAQHPRRPGPGTNTHKGDRSIFHLSLPCVQGVIQ